MRSSLLVVATLLLLTSIAQAQQQREISLAELRDRIRGGWAGKIIGVSFGAPTEFRYLGQIIPTEKLPTWSPEMVREALRQDDIYVQMTFADVLDAKGFAATTADYAAMFKETKYSLWHANDSTRRNLRRGVSPEETGTPRWNAHGNDICFQIDADFIGLSCPAMPRTAVQLIDPPARLIAWGDGLYAGSFIAGMYTKAYFETDPVKIVEAGLACLPPQSTYAQVIRDVLQWHRENPSADDWRKVWKLLQDKWDGQDFCTYGAMNSLNIDAKINGAYVAIGLLYGGDDFTKVLEIATRCGQDSDCNPCTACGIWAAARGYDKIPQRYTMGIPAMADEKFSYTDASFNSAVEHTIKRAIDYVKAAGGRVENDRLIIVEQSPTPAKTRDFNIGKPVGRIACDDPRWTWSGPWKSVDAKKTRLEKVATEKGAEATIKFTGTGAVVVGPFTGSSGRADVYLDGKLDRTADAWPDEDRREAMQALWHKYDLIDGEHTVRVVVRGETYGESKGTEIRIHSLVVFR